MKELLLIYQVWQLLRFGSPLRHGTFQSSFPFFLTVFYIEATISWPDTVKQNISKFRKIEKKYVQLAIQEEMFDLQRGSCQYKIYTGKIQLKMFAKHNALLLN